MGYGAESPRTTSPPKQVKELNGCLCLLNGCAVLVQRLLVTAQRLLTSSPRKQTRKLTAGEMMMGRRDKD